MRTFACLIVTGLLFAGTPALAAKKNASYQPAPQRLIFENEVVRAGRKGPDGTLVKGRRILPRSSLIRVRLNFLPELIKSAENL